MPLPPQGARRAACGDERAGARSGPRLGARDPSDEPTLSASASSARPRSASTGSTSSRTSERALRPELPRLPSSRRAHLADARPGRCARGALGRNRLKRLKGIDDRNRRARPSFTLPDTDGAMHEPGGAPATVVVFTCNHCPYALAWHERIVESPRTTPLGSSGARDQPQRRQALPARLARGDACSRAGRRLRGVPYLRDESQQVAHAYDAKTTPDVFVLDAEGILRYRGAPDADYEDPSQDAAYLRAALDARSTGASQTCGNEAGRLLDQVEGRGLTQRRCAITLAPLEGTSTTARRLVRSGACQRDASARRVSALPARFSPRTERTTLRCSGAPSRRTETRRRRVDECLGSVSA